MNHGPVSNLKVGFYHGFAPRTVTGRLVGHVHWEIRSCFKTGLEFFESINRSF